jgi:hypothetical protein
MRSPTAFRIFSKGWSAVLRSRPRYRPVRLLRRRIEGPDLHRRDALLQEVGREFVGAVEKALRSS